MAEGGPKAWVEFLEKEIAKRKQQRAAAEGRALKGLRMAMGYMVLSRWRRSPL